MTRQQRRRNSRAERRGIAALMRAERRRVAVLLRTEQAGGVLLVAAAVAALIIANSPLHHGYEWLRDLRIGPASLGLDLSVAGWAADGLLALFFFLAGLELKRELVVGQLRDPRRAAVPVAAAVGGMAVPAIVYLVVSSGEPEAVVGWAVPTATDIAFALAVLAVVGRSLPPVLRIFLLTLAVVDDLLAIVVIAIFYTRELQVPYLLASLVPIALFGLAVQRRLTAWWALLPLALAAWGLMHASGVHATVAGVLLGFTVPVLMRDRAGRTGHPEPRTARGSTDVAERLDRLLRPVSAGVAVPLFAFFAAGVRVGGVSGLAQAFSDRITLGVMAGLVVGKTVGILVTTLLVSVLVRSPLLRGLALADLAGLAVLGGVGFTVSLLIGELAFGPVGERTEHVRIAVLAGSLIAAGLAALVLGLRNRHYRRLPPATAR